MTAVNQVILLLLILAIVTVAMDFTTAASAAVVSTGLTDVTGGASSVSDKYEI